ncbi:hypothetical protein KJ652_07175 [Patescibacteria group bacterium]|nr:hypothetical protein [Patescibacteria group bacterium]MBU1124331.1 hypothetical protein [Patescibacteria group bacterium]MBU1911258.1 hypothetical protein [Patescibacteria group bacterium]
MYPRKCDATGKEILSMYSPDKPFQVYDQEYWWSDKWDPMQYGRDYDFNKPFFEQFKALSDIVPRRNVFTAYKHDENCEYTNHAGRNRNCYLIFDSDDSWDCMFCQSINSCKNCLDCYRTKECELSYECIDSQNLYNCKFCQNSVHCQDSAYLHNCIGCKNCMFCVNQHQKEYCLFNEQLTKEEYEQRSQELKTSSYKVLSAAYEKLDEHIKDTPRRYRQDVQTENCTGDYLSNCKNASFCFDSRDLYDCKYIFLAFMKATNCMDCNEIGDNVECCFQCSTVGYNARSCINCNRCLEQVDNLTCCEDCTQSNNSFGCVSLRKKEFCILNMQYAKEEYFELLPKIIDHLVSTDEWGKYFPKETLQFAYNESVAMDMFPLTKEEALAQGWKWKDDLPFTTGQETITWDQVADDIADIDDSICDEVLACEVTGKNFRITKQELAFYKKLNVALPRMCFDERHRRRKVKRNPWQLWLRKCDKCSEEIWSTFAPERAETVFCEECYHGEVYG